MMFTLVSILAFAASVSAECPIVGTYSGMTSLIPAGRVASGGCMPNEALKGNRLFETDFTQLGPVPSGRRCVAATCANVPIVVKQGEGVDDCLVEVSECFSNSGPGGEPATGTLGYDCSKTPDGNHDFACSSLTFQLGNLPEFESTGLYIEGNINGVGNVNWEVYTEADDKKVGMVSLSRKEEPNRNLRG
jgi:hypothetical protein